MCLGSTEVPAYSTWSSTRVESQRKSWCTGIHSLWTRGMIGVTDNKDLWSEKKQIKITNIKQKQ